MYRRWCTHCSRETHTYERDKIYDTVALGVANGKVSFKQVLDDLFGTSILKRIKCEHCDKPRDRGEELKFESGPDLLCLQLTRWAWSVERGPEKNTVHVTGIQQYLSLGQYAQVPKELNYRLYAVVKHKGTRLDSGHYVCHARSGPEGAWHSFNDAVVKPSSLGNAIQHGSFQPYLLFYERVLAVPKAKRAAPDAGEGSKPKKPKAPKAPKSTKTTKKPKIVAR